RCRASASPPAPSRRSRLAAPEYAVPDPPPRHEQERLSGDVARHLRLAEGAVDEVDGNLDDAPGVLRDAVRHLDLEAIPGRPHRREVDRPQHVGAVDAVAGGGVAHADAEDGTGVAVPPARQRLAMP